MEPYQDGSETGLRAGDWRRRLDIIVDTMRQMSRETDPQGMVRTYASRIREILPTDRFIAMSRRGLEFPQYRITRSSQWSEAINPWKEKHRLPLLEGGFLGELLYGQVPRLIDDFSIAGWGQHLQQR